LKISLFHEEDIRSAAQRVVELSREHRDRVVGMQDARVATGYENPYVTLFVELFQYARGLSEDDARAATQLEVARSVLGDPLYAGPEGTTESPLLTFVWHAVQARRKMRRGQPLTPEERSFLE
jgi:hypothetical protein